jgi:hypothetical protein
LKPRAGDTMVAINKSVDSELDFLEIMFAEMSLEDNIQ